MLDNVDERSTTVVSPIPRRPPVLRLVAAIDAGTIVGILVVFVASRLLWMTVFGLSPLHLVDALCQWDCKWYAAIAEHGYSREPHFDTFQADWAFFPGYPALTWLMSLVTRLPVVIAGTLVSNLAIVGAVWCGCRYLDRTRPGQGNAAFVVLTLAGPYSFYFATVYSEALCFALTCLAFWLWVSDRPVLSALAGAALSATRAIGVWLSVAFAMDLLQRHGRGTLRAVLNDPKLAVTLLLAPLGLFAFMAYLYAMLGDVLAFSHVQTAWHREFTVPFVWLAVGLLQWDLPKLFQPAAYSYFYSACWALAGMGLLVWLALARRWMEFSFGLFCLLVPLSAGLTSIPRFVVGCPVMLFAASDLLARLARRRVTMGAVLLVAVSVNLLLLAGWLNAYMSVI